ncbi:S41 family peptidase [Mesonia maritima]|uniref:Tail specific protease domain-containing protein n=1 Tax=Mesonia maritima TaxID=1793873 RepID=A0ABU1K4Y8_9FLAO|nr:S41 family peptidase [Mesonia maritima]MDR6300663.1 hypothetical protein [Mesonia maritima]
MKFLITTLLLMLTLSCEGQSSKLDSTDIYLVTFKSDDIGDIRFYLKINTNSNGKIYGGSLQNKYKENFNFLDRLKINWFSGIKDKRLIFLDGSYNNQGEFKTAFYSPLGNYYFKGKFHNNSIEGNVTTSKGVKKGTITGSLLTKDKLSQIADYQKISEKFFIAFEGNFFNPVFLKKSKYQNFKDKVLKYSTKSIDDLHYVFSIFYYLRSLPHSHIAIWRDIENEEEILEENLNEISYAFEDGLGILDINSFSYEKKTIDQIFDEIFKNDPEGLIIDLRNNPGGSIGPAIELSKFLVNSETSGGYFLSKSFYEAEKKSYDSCFVFSEGDLNLFMDAIEENECIEVKVFPGDRIFNKPIYIVVNESTASTCEPIAYALKKQNNIFLVGERTAGKMLSTKKVKLIDNFYLFVPNANYVTTESESIDQKGVAPEILIDDDEKTLKKVKELIMK